MRKRWSLIAATCLCLCFVSTASRAASGDEEFGVDLEEELQSFTFGDDCIVLQDISRVQVVKLTLWENLKYFSKFCRKRFAGECMDYNEIFSPLGRLVESYVEGYCQFAPYVPSEFSGEEGYKF